MLTRPWNYISSFFNSPNQEATPAIDFMSTSYDPTNKMHREYINAKINNFNLTYNALVKTNIIIGVPMGANTLLMLLREIGVWTSAVLYGAIAVTLYASDQWQKQNLYKTQFEAQLTELLSIYKAIVKTKGAAITEDETVLKIVNTIRHFVPSASLINWQDMQTYPDKDFSEKFVAMLSEAPHKIPRVLLKGNTPIPKEETQLSQAGMINSLLSTKGNKWFSLYKASKAEFTYALYGINEKPEEVQVQPSILSQFGLK